ncbi:MAG TPA: serine/threonine-protein kinase [Streptosporangiaceae bacterium]|nr:serine/threonine-protein kinase [Streptosporangiaceae bacterium]
MRAAMGAGRLIAGRYRLQDPIGRGATGVVWRGRDELLHRDVAVKEVMVTAGQAPGDSRRTIGAASYQRTLREARAAARLSHPGVVTVFDILDEAGSPWIVMELICGRSLDQVIAEDGPLPPRHAAQVGASLLSALAAAHAAGVLHRDVKPANVLVAGDGRVVLTDFGIAKIGADPGLTQLGMVVGTPGFTPPERVRGEPATPASDLWSLGATLYAAVEGRGPFERPGGVAAVCAGIAREEPPRAPSAGSLTPVIDALLRRDPGTRPDAATTATLLADAAAGPAGDAAGDAAADRASPSAGRPGTGHPSTGPADYPPADSRPDHGAARGPAAARRDSPGDPALTGTVTLPAPPHPGSRPGPTGFLDPPAFDQLSMPAPPGLPGQPLPPGGPASREPGLPAFLDPATRQPPSGARGPQPGSWPAPPPSQPRPGPPRPSQPRPSQPRPSQPRPSQPRPDLPRPGGPPGGQPRRGSWRLVAVGASIAAIVVAALLGLKLYDRTLTAVPDSPAGAGARAGTGAAASGPTGAKAGTRGSAAADTGSAAGDGPPPPGYAWHTFTAARLGAAAGFVIAVPARWQAHVQGQAVELEPPAGGEGIEVSLAPFTAAQPTAQARQEQAAAITAGQYPGYRRTAIEPTKFRGQAAAAWRFTWRSGTLSRTTVLAVLVTLPTSAGAQPYALSVAAPTLHFPAARRVYDTALTTFRPLPG